MPDVEMGCCLGSEGNRVSVGEGGKGGPSPPKISRQCLTKAEATWERTRRTIKVGRDEGGSAQTE